MININKMGKWRNNRIRVTTNLTDIAWRVKTLRRFFAGHMFRKKDNTCDSKLTKEITCRKKRTKTEISS